MLSRSLPLLLLALLIGPLALAADETAPPLPSASSADLPFASDSEKAEMQAPAASQSSLPVIVFTPWLDASHGTFTDNVPQQWAVSGGRNPNSRADVAQSLRVTAGDERVQVFINDPDLIPRQVPDVMTTTLAQLHEGRVIHDVNGAPLLLESYRKGAEFAQDYVWEKLCKTPQFTGGSEQREASERFNATQLQPLALRLHLQLRASIGDAYFRCGTKLGYVSATTLLTSPRQGPGAAAWLVFRVSGFIVERSVDARLGMYVLHEMEASLHIEPLAVQQEEDQPALSTDPLQPARQSLGALLVQLAGKRAEEERAALVGPSSLTVPEGWRLPGARGRRTDVVVEEADANADPLWGSRTMMAAYPYFWVDASGSIVATQANEPPDEGEWKPLRGR